MWTHTQTGRVREELSPLRGFIEPNEGETARLRECVASSSFVAANCWVSLNIAGFFFFFFFSKGLWLETRVWKKAIQGGQNSDLYPLRQPGGNKIILLVKIKMCVFLCGDMCCTRAPAGRSVTLRPLTTSEKGLLLSIKSWCKCKSNNCDGRPVQIICLGKRSSK